MLLSDQLLRDWTPVTNLCTKAIAKLGAGSILSGEEISSDVAVVLLKRGYLERDNEIKEASVLAIARRCAQAALRKRKKTPQQLLEDVAQPEPASKNTRETEMSEQEDGIEGLFKELLNRRPRVREVEETAQELMLDAFRQALRKRSGRDQAIIVRRLGEIRDCLNWGSTDPLADADRINNLLDEIRAVWRRPSSGQTMEPNMVKDDRVSEPHAVLMANHPARSPELDALLAAVVEHPESWMSTPSVQFGGRRPADLVGTEEEFKIFDILHAVDQGLF
jgi:hypothetical protein